MSYWLSLWENVSQGFCSQDVPQRGGCQQLGGAGVVINIGHGQGGVLHLVVHDGVDKHSNRVLGQDLRGNKILSYELQGIGILPPEGEHRMLRSSCQFSHKHQDKEWQRRLQDPWLLLLQVCQVWRWRLSHIPGGSDVQNNEKKQQVTGYLNNFYNKEEREWHSG